MIPMFNGIIVVEKVDDWIGRLELYFTLYCYSFKEKLTFMTLKLFKHVPSWWKMVQKQGVGKFL